MVSARADLGRRLLFGHERVEATYAAAEHSRHRLLDVALLALAKQGDVERDLARRDLGDRFCLADDGVVVVGLLGRSDERSLIVGHDDEAMLPELFEALLLELVAEHLA